jgi:hypothetical protein
MVVMLFSDLEMKCFCQCLLHDSEEFFKAKDRSHLQLQMECRFTTYWVGLLVYKRLCKSCERDQDLHWKLIGCVLDDASVTARLPAQNLIEDAFT